MSLFLAEEAMVLCARCGLETDERRGARSERGAWMKILGEIFFVVEPRGSASFRAASASVTAFLPDEDVQGIRVYLKI